MTTNDSVDIISRTLSLCGPTTTVGLLERLPEKDRRHLLACFGAQLPSEAIGIGYHELERRVRRAVSAFIKTVSAKRIVILGLNLDIIDALAREKFRGHLDVVIPASFPLLDLPAARRNVPSSLSVNICDPGLMPSALGPGDCIMGFGFYAGADLVLVDRHVAPTIGFVHGQRFRGETCLIMPNEPDEPFDTRPHGWNTSRMNAFRRSITPAGCRRNQSAI